MCVLRQFSDPVLHNNNQLVVLNKELHVKAADHSVATQLQGATN